MAIPETYMYMVKITRPIVLRKGVEIRTSRSLYLTKEEVHKCLETAYVYRRFTPDHIERVTKGNVDRLHQQTFMTEEEWAEKIKEGHVADVTPVNEEPDTPAVEEKKEEVKTEAAPVAEEVPANDIDIDIPEDVTDPTPVVEENDEQENIDDTNNADVVEEKADDVISDVVVEAAPVAEETQKDNKPAQNNRTFNYNNKHNRNHK